MLYLQLALAGVASGSIAALSGIGLVLTYRATGVFNFAHGAVAMFIAYVLWQLNIGWGLPLLLAAPLAVLVFAPLLGVLLERLVFRPLEVKGASTSEKLVATLGVFVVLVGLALTIWGAEHKTDAPNLFGQAPIKFGADLQMGQNQLAQLVIVLVSAALLLVLFKYSHTGTRIRAVVDRRLLADLAGVNANRVSALAWALGCTFAGLTGVLLAPQLELDPFRLTLLVVDTFAVAVVARLTSMPLGVTAGLFLGVTQSLLTRWTPPDPWSSLKPNLLVVTLLVFLVAYKSLNEREGDGTGRGLVSSAVGGSAWSRSRVLLLIPVGLIALAAPAVLSGSNLITAQQVLALAVIFLSVTAVTGFTGNITLGQAGFAGLGALLASRLSTGQLPGFPQLPVLLAMLVAALLVGLLGALTGYSALRRRGLFLGLTTLAIGLVLYRFVFESPYFSNRVIITRPSLFGVSLDGERAFYYLTLTSLVVTLLIVDRLRRRRLGRVLAALRDSELAARSIGIDLRAYKLLLFSVSATIAALGGSLLAQQQRAFVPLDFDPFHSLFWFTAVVVAGSSYLGGALLAAVLFVVLDAVLGEGASTLVIGLLALLVARFPAGIMGAVYGGLRRLAVPGSLVATYEAALAERTPVGAEPPPPAPVAEQLVPSQFATELLAEARR